MIKRLRDLNNRGDTIVEVLICLAILSLVLSSAYVLTNRNQATNQVAQERSESLKVADTQLELLRAYTDKHALPTFDYFCLQANGTDVQLVEMTNNPAGANPTYPAACTSGPGGRYTFVVWSPARATAIGGNGSSFAVTSRWAGLTTASEEVKVFYSVFNSNSPAYAQPPTDVTPAAECEDGKDNSDIEDALIDSLDPACHTDGNVGNVASFNPDIASELNPRCNNGVDDSDAEDTLADPADPGCHTDGNPTNVASYSRIDDDELDPLPRIRVVVEKIPALTGGTGVNNTPPCTNGGAESVGVSVRVQGGTENRTGSSTALFSMNRFNSSYTASLTMPSRFENCGTATQTVTTTTGGTSSAGTPPANQRTATFKIRPVCYISSYNSYWQDGNRRTDLDNYYTYAPYPSGGDVPDSYHGGAPGQTGTFHYVYAGFRNADNAKYFNLWETSWRSDPRYSCPS